MKETKLKASEQVCGMMKGPPRHRETGWWNRDVEKVVAKRKVCHKACRKSKSAKDKHTLDVSKKEVYTAVLAAQESKLQPMKVLERVLEKRIRCQLTIDKMASCLSKLMPFSSCDKYKRNTKQRRSCTMLLWI